MVLPFALSLALYYAQDARRRSRPRSRGEFIGDMGRPALLKCLLLLLAASLLFLGIVFSFSRMGMISMLCSLVLVVGMVWVGWRRHPQPVWFVLLLLLGGTASALWLGAGPVIHHFELLSRDDPLEHGTEGRMTLWKDSLQLIRRHPWTGSGLGCFEFAFTRVQSVELDYTIDHAHNDYLEFAVDLGIPAATLLFLAILVLAVRIFSAGLLARSALARAHALGAFGAGCALLIHSLADFNLQIPANALVFSVVLGIGYAVSVEARSNVVREPAS
jgi:O-antigen ligase